MHALILCAVLALSADGTWFQWGGPHRNFSIKSARLADSWPDGGPKLLWKRELGDGYSCVVGDNKLLHTLYRKQRRDDFEFAVTLDPKTGKTLWEHKIPAKLLVEDDSGWGGMGPNSTPVVHGDRVYVVSSYAKVFCFERASGKVFWTKDLKKDFFNHLDKHVGYSASPIIYENLIIVPICLNIQWGKKASKEQKGHALVAFDLNTGEVVWKKHKVLINFSSPILIQYDGWDQLVLTSDSDGLMGLNPSDGDLLWRHPVNGSVVTPVWDGKDKIFYSCGGSEGETLAIRLTADEGVVPEELWRNEKVMAIQATPVYVDGYLYGSTMKKLFCLNMETGECAWREAGFPMAACVHADHKLIILDERGYLTLAKPSPKELEVFGRIRVTKKYSFTVPTLLGHRLYVRDRDHIMAFDLR